MAGQAWWWLTQWHGDPLLVLALGVLAFGYLLPLVRRGPERGLVSRGQGLAFAGGFAALVAAVASPLHILGEQYLLTAHMVQHMLIIMLAVPLLLLGTPGWMLAPAMQSRWLRGVWRWLTAPVSAFAVYNLVFSLSHVPLVYDTALRVHDLHAVQHLVYMVVAVVKWWPVLSPVKEAPRLSYPGQALYIFAQVVPAFVLGAVITFADTVMYSWYAETSRLWGISAMDDQQLAGLIMWIGGAFYYLVVLGVVFFIWAAREEAVADGDVSNGYSMSVGQR